MDGKIRIGEPGCVLIHLILRSDVLMLRIPDINHCVNKYFETEES